MKIQSWMNNVSKPVIHFFGIADPVLFKKLQQQLESMEQQLQIKPPLERVPSPKKKFPLFGYFNSDPATFSILKQSLKDRFSLKTFSNWENVVRHLSKKPMPYFLVDLSSIGSQGLKALKLLRQKSPRTKIMALSSYLSAGLAHIMPKPLIFEEILQKPLNEEQLNKLR
ncbi:MAG: response regulator transcription factor [Deltaproteobacteria bacterium]|nr:response regulator transcription factor [Deltaproteobacteria bacterium]